MTKAWKVHKRAATSYTYLWLLGRTFTHHRNHRPTLRARSPCLRHSFLRGKYCDSLHRYRNYATSTISSILLPPAVYVGLLGTLWLYKCCMMVLFQNKIIYMPSIPPFSRREEIISYKAACRPVAWEERRMKSEDGTELALCVGQIPTDTPVDSLGRQVILLYFQGNGSSSPPRLPAISQIMKRLEKQQSERTSNEKVRYICVALSYRGYWRSRGRPSQRGIELDAGAALDWVNEFNNSQGSTDVILWGQSLGAGVALNALYRYYKFRSTKKATRSVVVKGVVLETPFTSIRNMLVALYPQRWLPYRYLWPFLRSDWDSIRNLHQLANFAEVKLVPFLVVRAGNDEIVPADQAGQLLTTAQSVGIEMKEQAVSNALHNEASAKSAGQIAITEFIDQVVGQ